jgi:DNA-binding NarL/FixJ family response regulator
MSVAVVGGDDFIMGRIRETLSRESIAVLDEVTEAPGLPEEAANASAILLVTGASAGERRTLVRTTAMSFPTTPVIVIASSSHGVPKALAAGAAGLVVGSAQ